MRARLWLFLVSCLLLAAACARQPSPAVAGRVIRHHFIRYAKHYPTSAFGQSRVANVDVSGIEEIHKRFVSAMATVTFQDGRTESVRCSMENRVPFGWKIQSWERLTEGPKATP